MLQYEQADREEQTMVRLSDEDIDVLADTTVSLALAIITKDPLELSSPIHEVTARVTRYLRAQSKRKAIERNVQKNFGKEATAAEVTAGVGLASRLAKARVDRKLVLETAADREKVLVRVRSMIPTDTDPVVADVAAAAMRGIIKNVVDSITQDPAMAVALAWKSIEDEKSAEADRHRYLPKKADDRHDWETGFDAEFDRRMLRDPRTAEPLVASEVSSLRQLLCSSWREQVQTAALGIPFPESSEYLEEAVREIRNLDTQGTYLSILNRLRDRDFLEFAGRVGRSSRKLFGGDNSEWLDAIRNARWLTWQASHPEMGLVLPIIGQWGSGKSRLTLEMARSWHLSTAPVLFVSRGLGVSMEQAVLASCVDGLGREPSNRMELAQYSSQFNNPLLIVLERLDRMEVDHPGSIREITDMIHRWSDQDEFRWLVTMDHNSLVHLPSDDLRDFWPSFGFSSSGSSDRSNRQYFVGGWHDLDSLNREEATGLKILETYGPVHLRADLSEARRMGTIPQHVAVAASPPLPAWLRVEAQDSRSLEDFGGAEFLRMYWESAVRHMDRLGANPAWVDAYSDSLSRWLRSAAGIPLDDLERDIQSPPGYWANSATEIVSAREALIQTGLIRVDRDLVTCPEEFAFLWGYRLANLWSTQDFLGREPWADEPDPGIAALNLRAIGGDLVAKAAVCSLFEGMASLGILGINAGGIWLCGVQLDSEIAWEAALTLEENQLAGLLEFQSTSGQVNSPRSQYLILRTARLRSFLKSDNSLMMLQAVARAIPWVKEVGAIDYCYQAILHQAEFIDWSSPEQTIGALEVCNSPYEARYDYNLAEGVLSLAERRIHVYEWLTQFWTFLDGNRSPENFRVDHGGLFSGDRSQRDHLTFWRALARLSFARLFDDVGPSAILKLLEEGWFDGRRLRAPARVRLAIEEEADVAFGHSRAGVHREEFLSILEALAFAEIPGIDAGLQRKTALFGIRHSGPTYGVDVTVDSSMDTAYRAVKADPDIRRLYWKWVRGITVRRGPID
jgi:hypothetical protein